MLIVLSPAKSLNLEPSKVRQYTEADLLVESARLIETLRPLANHELAHLMGISDALAELNTQRYASWQSSMDLKNAKQAMLMFDGDVYDGLDAKSMSASERTFAQSHLRILSGLYGVLRPLDLMLPYRLEMGTRLANSRGKDLYAFWGDLVSQKIEQAIVEAGAKTLLNLASEEYFKAVKPKLLSVPVIQPVFEDWKNGQYKVISFFAKRARGSMARYVITHKLRKAEQLKAFAEDGYAFDAESSGERKWVFRRRLEE